MKEITKRYPKDDISVVWKPHVCIHSGVCFRGLPGVFDPRRRPWIVTEAASREQIINQVSQCPSGALSIENIETMENKNPENQAGERLKISVMSKGPYLVKGECVFVDENGVETVKQGQFALCRCGGSATKPLCDGTHKKNNVL